jgi:hypothetical protein
VNPQQRENTAKLLLDLAKIIVAVFVVGGLVPNSPMMAWHVILAFVFAVIMYVAAMLLLKGD